MQKSARNFSYGLDLFHIKYTFTELENCLVVAASVASEATGGCDSNNHQKPNLMSRLCEKNLADFFTSALLIA